MTHPLFGVFAIVIVSIGWGLTALIWTFFPPSTADGSNEAPIVEVEPSDGSESQVCEVSEEILDNVTEGAVFRCDGGTLTVQLKADLVVTTSE